MTHRGPLPCRLLALVALLVAALWLPLAARAQPPSPASALGAARDALWVGDYAALQRLYGEVQLPQQRDASGSSQLTNFWSGVDAVMDGPNQAREAFYAQMSALTAHWAAQHPDAPLAHLLHVRSLMKWAFWHRGGGFSDTVTPQGWQAFERLHRQASDYMTRHAAVLAGDSSTFAELLLLGRVQNWDATRMWAVFDAGMATKAEPDRLILRKVVAQLPKWGGDALQLDRVAQDVGRRTQARHGEMLYAMVYVWAHDEQYQHRLFEESLASWPRMRDGLRQRLERYPDAANVNLLASFACLARDKPTAQAMLARIDRQPQLAAWGRGGRGRFDDCQRWAAQP